MRGIFYTENLQIFGKKILKKLSDLGKQKTNKAYKFYLVHKDIQDVDS